MWFRFQLKPTGIVAPFLKENFAPHSPLKALNTSFIQRNNKNQHNILSKKDRGKEGGGGGQGPPTGTPIAAIPDQTRKEIFARKLENVTGKFSVWKNKNWRFFLDLYCTRYSMWFSFISKTITSLEIEIYIIQ